MVTNDAGNRMVECPGYNANYHAGGVWNVRGCAETPISFGILVYTGIYTDCLIYVQNVYPINYRKRTRAAAGGGGRE